MAQSTEDNRALERKAFLNWKIDARDSAELHSLLSKHCLLDPKEKSPPLARHLQRERIVHDLAQAEKHGAGCGQGSKWDSLGQPKEPVGMKI